MHPFEAGETYTHPDYEYDIMVFAIEDDSDVDSEVWLAIAWIDPVTMGQRGADEIRIDADEYDDWSKREL
jgi:hypothetical protein